MAGVKRRPWGLHGPLHGGARTQITFPPNHANVSEKLQVLKQIRRLTLIQGWLTNSPMVILWVGSVFSKWQISCLAENREIITTVILKTITRVSLITCRAVIAIMCETSFLTVTSLRSHDNSYSCNWAWLVNAKKGTWRFPGIGIQ